MERKNGGKVEHACEEHRPRGPDFVEIEVAGPEGCARVTGMRMDECREAFAEVFERMQKAARKRKAKGASGMYR